MNIDLRTRFRFGVLLLAVTVGAAVAGAQEVERKSSQPHFRARDVQGPYGYSCSGVVVSSDVLPAGPFAQVGQVTCDGIATCEGTATTSFNGLILSVELTGTYTVNSNGTGFVLYDLTIGGAPAGQLPIDFVITDRGRGIKGLPITPGFAITCDLKSQKENGN